MYLFTQILFKDEKNEEDQTINLAARWIQLQAQFALRLQQQQHESTDQEKKLVKTESVSSRPAPTPLTPHPPAPPPLAPSLDLDNKTSPNLMSDFSVPNVKGAARVQPAVIPSANISCGFVPINS